MTRRAEITVTINDQTVMSWFSLIVKDVARGAEPHVMWWLLEGIEPSSDSRLSPVEEPPWKETVEKMTI